MTTLRPYQETARHYCNRQLNNSRNPLIVMAAGTGKTKMAVQVIRDRITLNRRVLVLVPQLEILDQWIVEAAVNKINYGYINDEGIIGQNKNLYIAMFQSLSGMLDIIPERFVKSFHEIITDEAHHSSAESYRRIYSTFSHCLKMGLTASPYRTDNQPLNEFYDSLCEPIKTSEAIAQGFLCRPVIIVPDEYKDIVPETLADIAEIKTAEQKKLIQDKKIIGDMIKVYKAVFNGLPVIIPCSGHAHAAAVKQLYEAAGWKVDHIHGALNKFERKAIVRRVKNKKTNILLTVGVGIEGLDIPGLSGIIWMRFTESLTIWIQLNGRAARIAEGKKYFILIDPVGNSVIHGRPDIDRAWKLDSNYTPGQDIPDAPMSHICPVCGVVNSIENNKCWICSYDFLTGKLDGKEIDKKKRRLPKMIDGELVFLDEIQEGENGRTCGSSVDSVHGVSDSGNIGAADITRTEKVKILSRNLTGLKVRTKFKEGLKWL
jgi:DNA repair protein RadD